MTPNDNDNDGGTTEITTNIEDDGGKRPSKKKAVKTPKQGKSPSASKKSGAGAKSSAKAPNTKPSKSSATAKATSSKPASSNKPGKSASTKASKSSSGKSAGSGKTSGKPAGKAGKAPKAAKPAKEKKQRASFSGTPHVNRIDQNGARFTPGYQVKVRPGGKLVTKWFGDKKYGGDAKAKAAATAWANEQLKGQ